ncbi:MAG: acyltransferase family protein [bacterium]
MNTQLSNEDLGKRLLSLDMMRGVIMFLLMVEAAGLYDILYNDTYFSSIHIVSEQFHHHPWNGLRFWDLIQPAFMFMAGTAMAYSVSRMTDKGFSKRTITIKMLKRSGWLFFWGVLNYAVKKEGLAFELWNVLTQLSVTLLISYLMFSWNYRTQIIFSIGILLLTEILYRFTHVPGFDQPFTDQYNFGNYIDLLLMGKINGGGWVAINCLPTAVHTIAGALVGKLLMSGSTEKIKQLLIWGFVTLIAGYSLDFTGITPIIKRIATTSFTLASLGWCLIILATFYYIIDIKNKQHGLAFFATLGMNSIFIYLFFEIVGSRWFNGYVTAITGGLLNFVHVTETWKGIIGALTIIILEWQLCFFLYKKKIFFRL